MFYIFYISVTCIMPKESGMFYNNLITPNCISTFCDFRNDRIGVKILFTMLELIRKQTTVFTIFRSLFFNKFVYLINSVIDYIYTYCCSKKYIFTCILETIFSNLLVAVYLIFKGVKLGNLFFTRENKNESLSARSGRYGE